MQHIDRKRSFWSTLITVTVIGLLIGILFLVLRAELLLRVVSVILGIITVLSAIPDLISGILSISTRHGAISFVVALITGVLGFVLIFSHQTVVFVLLGVFLILLPILKLVFAKERALELRRVLPQILLGVILVFIGPARVLNLLFDVVGILVILLTLLYVVGMVLSRRRAAQRTGGRVFVDSDSDGRIDAVYIDTTGDGRTDTSVEYRDGDR